MAKQQKGKKNSVSEEFMSEVAGLSVDSLQGKVVDLYKEIEDLLQAKAEDPDLLSLKEQLKEANSSYSSRIKELKGRISYILEVIESRGK